MKTLKSLLILAIFSVSLFAQSNWEFDKPHTKIGFSVTHLVITEVEGNFLEFEGNVKAENDNFKNLKVDLDIDVASISTDISARDKHLKSDDFFNVEKFPKMTFRSKSYKKVAGNRFQLTGDLQIRDVKKEIVLDVIHRGTVKGPMGKKRAGFKLTGDINRFDYNLKWNKTVEAGPIVDKTIKLVMNVELIKK